MSFDANVLSVKPVIREAANMNNDGGGNLGYMQRGKNEEEKEKKFLSDESIFDQRNKTDLFINSKKIEIPEEYKFDWKKVILKFLAKIRRALKF